MKDSFKGLFESVKIGRVEVKNRIALAPMGFNTPESITVVVLVQGIPGVRT